jgi:hypothetical protein
MAQYREVEQSLFLPEVSSENQQYSRTNTRKGEEKMSDENIKAYRQLVDLAAETLKRDGPRYFPAIKTVTETKTVTQYVYLRKEDDEDPTPKH